MVQKEVALKLTDKTYKSPLTLMIESVGHSSISMNVSRNVFDPAPRVDSAILSITIEREYNPLLTQVLKAAFTQKRKTIYNNLKELFNDKTNDVLSACGLDPKLRAEQLEVEDYIHLTKYL